MSSDHPMDKDWRLVVSDDGSSDGTPEILRTDALVLLSPPGAYANIPGKVYDYLRVRRPILYIGPDNPVAQMIARSESGICCRADDMSSVAEAIAQLHGDWQNGLLERRYPCTGNGAFLAENCYAPVLRDLLRRFV